MTLLTAIAGSPTRWEPAPDDAPAAALAAVAELGRREGAKAPFGFLDTVGATWDAHHQRLRTYVPGSWTSSGSSHTIEWRWGRLWEDVGNWYEVGWHPDCWYVAMLGSRQRQLWATLNPGKDFTRLTRPSHG